MNANQQTTEQRAGRSSALGQIIVVVLAAAATLWLVARPSDSPTAAAVQATADTSAAVRAPVYDENEFRLNEWRIDGYHYY